MSLQGLPRGQHQFYPFAVADSSLHTQDARLGSHASTQDCDPSIRAAAAACFRDNQGRFATSPDTSAGVEPFGILISSSRLDPASAEPA